MTAAIGFELYRAPTGSEWIATRPGDPGIGLLMLPAPFEEGPFTRTLVTRLLRAAAARGVGSWLPDLPGQGESRVSIGAVRLRDWQAAAAAAFAHATTTLGTPPLVASVRGGALIADALPARARWRLAPCDGAAVLRPLRRAQALSGGIELAGWPLADALIADLGTATLAPADAATRDVAWPEGTPPWRRAEPAAPADEVALLTDDLTRWLAACAAC